MPFLRSEMTIALTGAGLDPGLGIFHTDALRRASLTYDAMEAVRPSVDGWLAAWLADARFSKRDFYEESDGTIRITRPLTSHLAMTAPIWRPAAQAVAGWLAGALTGGLSEKPRPTLAPPRAARPSARFARDATAHAENLHGMRKSARHEAAQILFAGLRNVIQSRNELRGCVKSRPCYSRRGSCRRPEPWKRRS